MFTTNLSFLELVLRGSLVYFAVLLLLRLGGKRQIGQLGDGEFVAILLISNAVQNAMNGGDNSLTAGIILACVIIALSLAVSYLSFRFRRMEIFFQGRPRLLIHHGKLLKKNLDKELLSMNEFKHLLRKQGIHNMSDIEEAVMESSGAISVINKNERNTDTLDN